MSMNDADLFINMSLLEVNVFGLKEAVDRKQLRAIRAWLDVIRKSCGDIERVVAEREVALEQFTHDGR